MNNKELTFKQAFERLKEIYYYLKSNETIDIDEMVKLQQEAKELYRLCKNKLKNIEQRK